MFLEAGKKRVRIKWKGLENSVDVNKENDSLFSVESLENSGEIKKETERWTFSAKKERMLSRKEMNRVIIVKRDDRIFLLLPHYK